MKRIFFLLLIIANSVTAQNVDSLFVSANNLYKDGKFSEAIEFYKQIETKELVSSELYYNLGNSYYKLNKVGPAIYYYEKALILDPLNADVKNNLVFAKRLALDNIEELPKTVLQKFKINYLQKLSYNQWAIVVVVFSILGSFLFLIFYFADGPTKKRFYFTTSIISFILLIASLFITYNQYNFALNNKEAIVFAEETDVRNAPTLNSEEIFTLHEGTKIIVLDGVDEWKKVKINDGRLGWIHAEDIKLLNDI
ncbi:tetratricopeptide repeat protein [Polaribacter undariae]|uniref:Tetratricopeptide repeat protein n=1 Tax=Polaribacter sejongensis TaxID=985043 RepID=A0AAJ1QUH7_9FLAO|nr:tetratricopeptide repeat protein [Polaribacter undariae]MDN3618310.1 tetratricopeptide repeat protein [Polaribacter undariae]UWD30703.1 tetratricopeptide repeat protein [Polaribacter undariae]